MRVVKKGIKRSRKTEEAINLRLGGDEQTVKSNEKEEI